MTVNENEWLIPSRVLSTSWGCADTWSWNRKDKSHEVRIYGPKSQTCHFHPNWSNGTAGVRGNRILNRGCYFWEIKVSRRIFGTSMMFGICTKSARLHVDAFVNMLGEDKHSWGLSHKGLLWHDGQWRHYTKPFRENEAATIGILFDGHRGTLVYYKDGICLGVAFRGLNLVQEDLYPVVCSTAAKTEMSLAMTRREFYSLQDRCRSAILASVRDDNGVQRLRLPNRLKAYLGDHQRAEWSSNNQGATSSDQRDNNANSSTANHDGHSGSDLDFLDPPTATATSNSRSVPHSHTNVKNSCLFV